MQAQRQQTSIEQQMAAVLKIEASIAKTHGKVMNYLNKMVLLAELKAIPVPDVKAVSEKYMPYMYQTNDAILTTFDYYRGGHHLERNGWKMWEKIHAKRLKARAELVKMWANPKKRALIKEAEADILFRREEMQTKPKTKPKAKPAPVLPSIPEEVPDVTEPTPPSPKVTKSPLDKCFQGET